MTVEFKTFEGRRLFNLGIGTSRRVRTIVEAVAYELQIDSGMVWLPWDEVHLHGAALEAFGRALCEEWSKQRNPVYRGLMAEPLAFVAVLCAHLDCTLEVDEEIRERMRSF